MPTDNETHLRSSTRAQLIANGVPSQYVDQVVDLGFHAAERAIDTLNNIVWTAGDQRVGITALGVAIGIAQNRLTQMLEAMVEVGTAAGLPTKEIVVEAHHG